MNDDRTRIQILEMIESGKISTDEGLKLLEALRSGSSSEEEAYLEEESHPQLTELMGGAAVIPLESPAYPNAGESTPAGSAPSEQSGETTAEPDLVSQLSPGHSIPPAMTRWRRWWMIPLWVGVFITVTGGLLMYLALSTHGVGFWFVLAAFPFILGVVITVLAWQARTSRWIHLRIQQKEGSKPRRIALSFPLPLRISAWFLRSFGHKIPNVDGAAPDQWLTVLEKTGPDNPLYIEVDDEDGERVEIYIG